ncbi:MAG: hypothetical protein ACLFM4_12040 [Phormidium sp.]
MAICPEAHRRPEPIKAQNLTPLASSSPPVRAQFSPSSATPGPSADERPRRTEATLP